VENLKTVIEDTSLVVKQASLFLNDPVEDISDGENPSTNIDVLISEFLTESLKKIINVDVLSEEEASNFIKPNDYFWLIDPIDGTMNFISGSPDVAISVALVDKFFNAIISVVYLPSYNEMFTAIKNEGAYLNGKILNRVDSKLNIVAYGLPGDAPKRKDNITKVLSLLIQHNYVLRQSGSAVVDICRVAKGTWQAFFEEGLYIWDIAAANLIVQESGRQSYTSLPDIEFKCDYVTGESNSVLNEIRSFIGGS
jgi:myo-inositol-1(or 4)-monophosphatase